MKERIANFETTGYSLTSFLWAVFFCIISFSILPISMLGTIKKNDDKISYTRVYSLNEKPLKNNIEQSNNISVPNFSMIMSSVQKPSISALVPNISESLSSVKVFDGFDFVGGGDFSISTFELASENSGNFNIETFEIDSLDRVPRRIKGSSPKYPKQLLMRRIEGNVSLLVIIDEYGNVSIEKVLNSSSAEFTESALRAVSNFKYEVPTKNGKPVRAKFILPIPFRISQ